MLIGKQRGMVLRERDGSCTTTSWPETRSESDMEERVNITVGTRESLVRHPKLASAGDINMAQQYLIFQMAPGIRLKFPMMKEDLEIIARVENPWCGGQRRHRQLSLGPRSRIHDIFYRLLGGDKATRAAIVCHAFGNETPIGCRDCGDGPFDNCVVHPNQSNGACSNCIYSGNERLCEWRARGDLDLDNEYESGANFDNERDVDINSGNGHDNVPPGARNRRRTRSDPTSDEDSGDPDYVPPEVRNDSNSDYVPPKTRNAGRSSKSVPKRHAEGAEHDSLPSKRQRRSTKADRIDPKLSVFVDLTGEDD